MFFVTANILQKLQKNKSIAFRNRKQANRSESKIAKHLPKELNRTMSTVSNAVKQVQIDRFYTYFKIFAAMGITWIGEFIAFLISNHNIEWLTFLLNLPNLFQGVFVFLVFGLKKVQFKKSQQQLERKSSAETSTTGGSSQKRLSLPLVNTHPAGLGGRSVSFSPTRGSVTFSNSK